MKTVLLPTAPLNKIGQTLECALLLARRFNSYVEGIALRPPPAENFNVDMIVGMTWTADERSNAEGEDLSRRVFESFMTENALLPEDSAPDGPCYGWAADAPRGDDFIGSYSRAFDVTVLGQPSDRAAGPRMSTLEAVLFESGRPALIAPPEPVKTLGETIVIAWNGSTETAHTVAMSMPLLHFAKHLVVLTVEGAMVTGPNGEQLARSLQRHGLEVDAIIVSAEKRNSGKVILDYATGIGCDLLVKGAYTKSRMRQMIFGGATSHIVANATMSVFMSH